MLLVAAIEVFFAFFKLGKYVDLVSDSVLKGFLNGLGCLLIKSQVSLFTSLSGTRLLHAVVVASATAYIVKFAPRFTDEIPSPLVAVTAVTAASKFFSLKVATLASTAGYFTFAGGLSVLPKPMLALGVPFTLKTMKVVFPVALSIAMISILETLLAGKVIEDYAASAGEMGSPSDNDRMLSGLALGTAASAMMGGFGGCGLIPQTLLNAQSGGRGIVSSVSYALCMGVCVVLAAPLIGSIPVASLAGVMLTVAASTVQIQPTLGAIRGALRDEGGKTAVVNLTALIVTSFVCYFADMATGIGAGVVITVAGDKLGKA
mmetsp:Transcript_39803/g.77944  ORF Transcript_39803/g.77944 Transcript_39803/m.77944 type:complete len:318 (+) Transcript_39803:104-1057(+)